MKHSTLHKSLLVITSAARSSGKYKVAVRETQTASELDTVLEVIADGERPAASTRQVLWAANAYRTAIRKLAALPPDTPYPDVESALRHANEAFWHFSQATSGDCGRKGDARHSFAAAARQ